MHDGKLSDQDLERLAIFALGLALGFIVLSLAACLLEEWVIASDQADRRRIREELAKMLDAAELAHDDQESERDERAFAAAIVSTPRPGKLEAAR